MKDFNINQYVGLKLTEEGLKILESQYNELLSTMNPEAAESLGDFKAPQVDEEGYSHFRLWILMNHFGKYMYNGNPKPPFEMTITFSDKDLTKHYTEKNVLNNKET